MNSEKFELDIYAVLGVGSMTAARIAQRVSAPESTVNLRLRLLASEGLLYRYQIPRQGRGPVGVHLGKPGSHQ